MRLWMPIVLTPLIVLTQLSANYALVALECAKQQRFAIHLVSAISLALVVAGMLLAWSAWREVGTEPPDDRAEGVTHVRFVAALGVAVSALMTLGAIAQWLTTAFVAPCIE